VLLLGTWNHDALLRVWRGIELENGSWLNNVKDEMASLLYRRFSLNDKEEPPSKAYKLLICLTSLIRGVAGLQDGGFLVDHWPADVSSTMQVKFNPFDSVKAGMLLGKCKTWEEFEKGMIVGKEPTFAVFSPEKVRLFGAYDIVTTYFAKGKLIVCRGIHLTDEDPATIDIDSPPYDGEHIQKSILVTTLAQE
jgi:hypothetical protein